MKGIIGYFIGGLGILSSVAMSGITLNKINGKDEEINKKIEEIENEIEESISAPLRGKINEIEMTDKQELYDKLKGWFDKHDIQVKKIEQDLKEEKTIRENDDKFLTNDAITFDERTKKLEKMSSIFTGFLKDFKEWQNTRRCVSATTNGRSIVSVLPELCEKIWKDEGKIAEIIKKK